MSGSDILVIFLQFLSHIPDAGERSGGWIRLLLSVPGIRGSIPTRTGSSRSRAYAPHLCTNPRSRVKVPINILKCHESGEDMVLGPQTRQANFLTRLTFQSSMRMLLSLRLDCPNHESRLTQDNKNLGPTRVWFLTRNYDERCLTAASVGAPDIRRGGAHCSARGAACLATGCLQTAAFLRLLPVARAR